MLPQETHCGLESQQHHGNRFWPRYWLWLQHHCESGTPLASFVYKTQPEAITASIHARSLIENAILVMGAPPGTD